jgi:hypothetical protein
VEDATFDFYRWNAVYSSEARLTIHNSRFANGLPENPMAIRNGSSRLWVDASYNWWGDASGPHNAAVNPTGTGAPVTDKVLFFPWAVDEAGTVPTQVLVQGPTRISPGDTAEYAVSYFVSEPLQDAVLIVDLPAMADYVDATGEAVRWPERNEVYWPLGDIGPTEGSRSLRVLYDWGLPNGSSDNLFGRLAASNLSTGTDAAEYLAHTPRLAAGEALLSEAELNAQLAANADLSALFDAAVTDGFLAPRATRLTTSLGETILEIMLIHPERGAVTYLTLLDGTAAALLYDRNTFRAYDVDGGMQWDLSLDHFSSWGSWGSELPAARASRGVVSFSRCFFNCVAPKLTLAVIKKTVKTIGLLFKINSCFTCGLSKGTNIAACAKCENAIKPLLRVNGVPVLGETIDVTVCAATCAGQQGVVFPCQEPLLTCDSSVARGVWTKAFEQCSYRKIPCEDGLLVPEQSYVVNSGCATDFCKCVEGKGCQRCSEGSRSRLAVEASAYEAVPLPVESGAGASVCGGGAAGGESACSVVRTAIRVARDPNAKEGPAGDVIPGQEMAYTVEYENVGAGRAYGVYIVDELSPSLDETTLELNGQGEFFPATRTIVWDIGELAPHGEEGAKGAVTFSVHVKAGLAGGTVITNQAIVYFPSVPEETPTNTAVNVVQPLAAIPQSVETTYRSAIPITLAGRDVSGTVLSYAIGEEPLNGTLTGTAPSLSYTPAENFTGQDRFTFTVSNGVSESRPADVTVLVQPSSADTVPPEVLWTYPEDGAVLEEVPTDPLLSDEEGPLYAPSVLVGFSEAMDPNTITDTAVTVRSSGDREIAALVSWDGMANQAVLVAREPWQAGNYTATVTTGVRDASGNSLASGFVWSFRVAAAPVPCTGDCDASGEVTVDELIRGVNIALGTAAVAQCPSFDANGDGAVTVSELITAVNNALGGCS